MYKSRREIATLLFRCRLQQQQQHAAGFSFSLLSYVLHHRRRLCGTITDSKDLLKLLRVKGLSDYIHRIEYPFCLTSSTGISSDGPLGKAQKPNLSSHQQAASSDTDMPADAGTLIFEVMACLSTG